MKEIIKTFFDKIDSLSKYPYFSLDSRNIGKGDVFFAFAGEKVDGHHFIDSVLTKEPCWIVGTKKIDHPSYIQVENTAYFLQQLAIEKRNRLAIPIVGLTGSNAKTTSKELIYSVLKSKYKVYATEGNYNNHLGVPLSILNIPPDTEIGIIEMGANHIGEIEFLCHIARPTIGTITNIGKAHIGEFGGFENIVIGKTELYRYLRQNKGKIVFRNDDPLLKEQVGDYSNAFSYGETSADLVFLSYSK